MVLRKLAAAVAVLGALAPAAARADGPAGSLRGSPVMIPTPDARPGPLRTTWRARYERARQRIVDGDYRQAERDLRALAAEAEGSADRALAEEMADLAKAYADRLEAVPATVVRPRPPRVRSGDELTLLYASSFLYGAGTGVWFLLLTEPDSAATATLPFAAITAAPVIAVATIDGSQKLPRGVPHAISAGLYLGLGQGIWIVGHQHARATRIEDVDPRTNTRWKAESVSSVLWGSATLGGVLGGVLGGSLVTTPGRVSFTASTTIWSGAITGLAAAAILPDDGYRAERAFVAGGVGYNAGLLGGMLGASAVSPSVTRVRIVDLLGAAGAITASGLYLAIAHDAEARPAEGLAALGAAAGLGLGWWATSGMKAELPVSSAAPSVQPAVLPAAGGASIGVVGSM